MSYALHKEIIRNTHVNLSLSGTFVRSCLDNKLRNFPDQSTSAGLRTQILLVKTSFFEIYEIIEDYCLSFLCEYKVFGEITSVEKLKIKEMELDCIALAMNYAKIALVQYDHELMDFKILCLYNFENENLSNGKKFYKESIQLNYSYFFECLSVLSNDTVVSFLPQLDLKRIGHDSRDEINELDYIDALSGQKYFLPSFYINFSNYGVSKIIKIYNFYRQKEKRNFFEPKFLECDFFSFFILYKDSGMTSENEVKTQNLPFTGITQSPFMKEKINFALVSILKDSRKVMDFDIWWENLESTSFDIFGMNETLVGILAPYCIQVYDMKCKILHSIVLNKIYYGVFQLEYSSNKFPNVKGDFSYLNLNLDLRGGSYMVISDTQFIFTTSTGSIYVLSYDTSFLNYKIEELVLENHNAEAPYSQLLMPFPGIFFLSSYFADSVLFIYDGQTCSVKNKILSISPIIDFHVVLDRFQSKFIFTSGYNKSGSLNFLYDKLFYDITYATHEYQEISYLKALDFQGELYSKFLCISFKSGKSLIYKNGKILENIGDKYGMENQKIISCQVIKLFLEEYIVIVTDSVIGFYDNDMNKINLINLTSLLQKETSSSNQDRIEDKIQQVKWGENCFLFNSYYEKYFYCSFDIKKSETEVYNLNLNNQEHNNCVTNNIDEGHVHICFPTSFPSIYFPLNLNYSVKISEFNIKFTQSQKILKYTLNTNLINDQTYLVILKENSRLEIYNIKNPQNPIFENNLISELPVILSDNKSPNYFNTSQSDITCETNFINNQTHIIESFLNPEEIFFDKLERKSVFSMVYRNGVTVFYEVLFKESNQILMKKFHTDFTEEIDYRDLFYSENSNLYIPLSDIANRKGVLLNIKGNQKVLFEIKGKLKFLDFENNAKLKRSFSAFSTFSREGNVKGFVYYENGYLTFACIPKNYSIEEVGLLRRNSLEHFPSILNYLVLNQNAMNIYYYITIEKEYLPTNVPVQPGGIIQTNKFFFSLFLRSEDCKIINEVKFQLNETVTESKIVELYNIHKIKTKFIAIGLNICDEKGEESACKAKLLLFNIENGKFVNVLQNELRGVISMIQSIDGILLVSEGCRIYLYQYIPIRNEIQKVSVIENKNLVVCSKIQSKYIITGDIFESASWLVFNPDLDINSTSIYLLGKDTNSYTSTAIDFWIDDSEQNCKTGCLLADKEKNLHIFLTNTELDSSERLQEVADLHLGKTISELRYFSYNNKSFVYYSATNGSIGIIKPISKLVHDRLSLLCEYLYNHLPFRGGLNPKIFYSTYMKQINYKKEKGNFVDFDLLNFYLHLPVTTQKVIAKNVITSRETLLHSIYEIK